MKTTNIIVIILFGLVLIPILIIGTRRVFITEGFSGNSIIKYTLPPSLTSEMIQNETIPQLDARVDTWKTYRGYVDNNYKYYNQKINNTKNPSQADKDMWIAERQAAANDGTIVDLNKNFLVSRLNDLKNTQQQPPTPQPEVIETPPPQVVIETPPPPQPEVIQPSPTVTANTCPPPQLNNSSLNNSAELAWLTHNNNEIININTNLSTLKERVNNIQQQQQQQQQQQSIYKKITDGITYSASTQKTPTNIVPLFEGPISEYPDYQYKECWSYGDIPNGLTYPVVNGGIFQNVTSIQDCVKMAATNGYASAAYNGSNLCLAGGGEYKNYTKMACDTNTYGKKAWQVYSKV
jgi:hypothetical protein